MAAIGFACSIPACCCGGPTAPPPGPPGTISGTIRFTAATPPGPAAVYAVSVVRNDYAVGYAMTRVSPPQSTYQLAVPPGYYLVVARLDSDPGSSAGASEDLKCGTAEASCPFPRSLSEVRVESKHRVDGVDVGDWGNASALYELWRIDLFGTPFGVDAAGNLSLQTAPSPTYTPPYRSVPASPAPDLATEYDTGIGVRVGLPAGWHEIASPVAREAHPLTREAYFANQPVRSPLGLDHDGVWLTVTWNGFLPCVPPYPLTATGQADVFTSYSLGHFYFRDPPHATSVQPLMGYAFMGGTHLSQGCMGFIFVGSTMAARDSNLATFAAIVKHARYSAAAA